MRLKTGRRASGALVMLALTLTSVAVDAAAAAKPSWDRPANIRASAARLADMQKRQGAEAVVKFLDACYRTHTLASEFSEALEGCMAQDLMFSQVLASVFSRLTPESRRERKLPSPEQISASMSARIGSVVTQYKLKDAETKALSDAVALHGMPIFMAAMFPPKTGDTAKP